ncbi:transposase [bacterium]|nr:transposase [bacterium]
MAKRQFQLSEAEIVAFRQAEAQTRDVRELKRLQAVRLYGSGESVDTIQKLVGCGPASPRQWVIKYRRGGLTALKSHWAVGNAKKLSDEQHQDLFEKLEQYSPEQVIAPDVRVQRGIFWTVSDLQIVIEQWYGVTYRSLTSYRSLLHASGLSYQKVETVYRSQPGAVQLADFEAALEKN